MFLMTTLSISIIRNPTLGAEPNEDRIGTILSYMARMSDDMKLLNQKVDGVQKEVKDVARIEEHLLKLKDKVADVITKQGNIENQVNAVKNQARIKRSRKSTEILGLDHSVGLSSATEFKEQSTNKFTNQM